MPISLPLTIPAPTPPKSLADLGIPLVMMRDIMLKTMFRMSLTQLTDLSRILCLPNALAQELIDIGRSQKLIEATGTLHATAGNEMGYQLTEAGAARAQEALAQSEYYGALPVPLDDFKTQVAHQSVRSIQLTREDVTQAMGHLILPPDLINNLGPAISSGRSILLYGPPGNGKSAIANGIQTALGDKIYIPRAVTYGGQIITVYDPTVHVAAKALVDDPKALRRQSTIFDSRYVLCNRPVVITGGELTLDMLDLSYNKVSRTYQASLQMKASGGLFIIDDLGRQVEPPQKLINRWIVPLEECRDILTLQSGEKFTVPFDTLVIFSTNFHPNEIFDGAALRRIFFKIKIDGPDQQNYLKIFAMIAHKKGMPLSEDALRHLMHIKYPSVDNLYANYQPGFLIDQMIAFCDFEGIPRQMSPALIDKAWANMFVRDEIIRK